MPLDEMLAALPPLTPTQQRIMAALFVAHGEWVMPAALVSDVWGYSVIDDSERHLVRVNISRLRQALIGSDWQIETHRGFSGYRLVQRAAGEAAA